MVHDPGYRLLQVHAHSITIPLPICKKLRPHDLSVPFLCGLSRLVILVQIWPRNFSQELLVSLRLIEAPLQLRSCQLLDEVFIVEGLHVQTIVLIGLPEHVIAQVCSTNLSESVVCDVLRSYGTEDIRHRLVAICLIFEFELLVLFGKVCRGDFRLERIQALTRERTATSSGRSLRIFFVIMKQLYFYLILAKVEVGGWILHLLLLLSVFFHFPDSLIQLIIGILNEFGLLDCAPVLTDIFEASIEQTQRSRDHALLAIGSFAKSILEFFDGRRILLLCVLLNTVLMHLETLSEMIGDLLQRKAFLASEHDRAPIGSRAFGEECPPSLQCVLFGILLIFFLQGLVDSLSSYLFLFLY